MAASARRHLQAAEDLLPGNRKDVAGYLFGIAAECAVKSMMGDMGLKLSEVRREDPYYAHFPQLRTMLKDKLTGRSGAVLARFISDDRFLSEWDTNMRYSNGKDIKAAWVQRWAEQARDVVGAVGT